ncbi:MAG: DEAD/DEAH box helicase [Candidatus Aenigmatarchaeota archaeon]|nr:MAG: DEAD/DEAH box helicase [Candidatus Aenigmarchaeota archaeon]
MAFGMFSEELRKLVEKRFHKPTEVQEKGIPPIHRGRNTLVIASTGTGKTESVLLPLFDKWLRDRPKKISILYITPLKSLNRDLEKRISWWANHLDMEVSVRHGDTSTYERSMQVANPPDMMISTPETLQAMLTGKRMRGHLSKVRYVVVDEIHELVGNKRGIQLSVAIERLRALAESGGNPAPQFVGLSATVGTPQEVARFLAGEKCDIVDTTHVKEIDLRVEHPLPDKDDSRTADSIFVSPEIAARLRSIRDVLNKVRTALIFTNTRQFAEVLSSRLRTLYPELPIETHHSSLSKQVRIEAEKRLKDGGMKALVCTSSLELGIDIGEIDLTLQYMSPRQVAKLLQRIGRAGHSIDRTSQGIIMTSDPDDIFESAVIARKALHGEIEESEIYSMALDVLAHQIVGLSLEEYKIPAKKAFEIVRMALPYKKLTYEKFLEVCALLQRLRLVWLDERFEKEVVIKRRRGSFQYYYTNLSTIPDVKQYKIIDIVTNTPVGTLDAEFVALHGSPGTSFIVKGQAWRILDVRKSSIVVEPEKGVEAAIPAWEGELMPVPFDVAQKVGALRREISSKLSKGQAPTVQFLKSKYPVETGAAKKMISAVKGQKRFGHVPDDKEILIEYARAEDGYHVVIHSCRGSLVNETLGRVLTVLLSNRMGSVGLQTDPYRIMIKIQSPRWKDVIETFRYMEPGSLDNIIDISVPKTELFTWRFLHVANRLGIIDRNADFGKGYLNKVVDAYLGTPAYEEALNEIKREKLDIGASKRMLHEIQEGKTKIVVKEGLSPFGKFGLERKYEIVAPEKPEKEIREAFRNRILNTKLRLVCADCGRWALTARVSEEPRLRCPRCGARIIAVTHHRDTESEKVLAKYLKKKKLTPMEKKYIQHLHNTGTLVMNYGEPALKALAGRGVGWTTAKRILAGARDDEELYRMILEAERKYAKTKRFWKD